MCFVFISLNAAISFQLLLPYLFLWFENKFLLKTLVCCDYCPPLRKQAHTYDTSYFVLMSQNIRGNIIRKLVYFIFWDLTHLQKIHNERIIS